MRVALATLATALAARGARGAAAGAACAPPLPAGYSLEHVQLFVRHGDRTPITPSLERAFWLAKLPSASRLAEIQAGTDRVDSSGPRDRGFSHSASGDGVYGTLTARGIEQMRETGVALRAELIDTPDAPLLGPTLSLAQLAVHSTDFPRTIESTQARAAPLRRRARCGSQAAPPARTRAPRRVRGLARRLGRRRARGSAACVWWRARALTRRRLTCRFARAHTAPAHTAPRVGLASAAGLFAASAGAGAAARAVPARDAPRRRAHPHQRLRVRTPDPRPGAETHARAGRA